VLQLHEQRAVSWLKEEEEVGVHEVDFQNTTKSVLLRFFPFVICQRDYSHGKLEHSPGSTPPLAWYHEDFQRNHGLD